MAAASNLTEYLVEQAGGMITISPEIRDEGKGYMMFDDGAVEVEVAEFLYGLIRLTKPEKALTTGIYTGISDLYIAKAMKDNGYGSLECLEIETTHLKRANKLWQKCGVDSFIVPWIVSSLEFDPKIIYDFMFLDSEPSIRFAELVRFFPNLNEGGYVGIHDLPRGLCQGNVNPDHPELKSYPYGDIPEQMKDWIKTDKLRLFHFSSPRGLTFFYKVKPDDYHV